MYNFLKMHKEATYNSDIPHFCCFCEVCENAPLLAKEVNSSLKSSGILSSTVHNLVEAHPCDLSSNDCMPGNCPEYLKPWLLLFYFKADVDLITFLQFQRVENQIAKVNQTMPFHQVISQPCSQSNFEKIDLAPNDFARSLYLIWLVNCKKIEINLYKTVNFL